MGKKRRVLNNPKFAALRKTRFPHFFDEAEPNQEEAVIAQKLEEKVEQPRPVLKEIKPEIKAKKENPKLVSKKTTTKAKAPAKRAHKPAAKKRVRK